jgi:hypothetical protein
VRPDSAGHGLMFVCSQNFDDEDQLSILSFKFSVYQRYRFLLIPAQSDDNLDDHKQEM